MESGVQLLPKKIVHTETADWTNIPAEFERIRSRRDINKTINAADSLHFFQPSKCIRFLITMSGFIYVKCFEFWAQRFRVKLGYFFITQGNTQNR